ncbi:MAG TPA: hypothetical protein PLU78_04995 [Chitinophagales bacterium]|jgi:hypothetical protein|nr:hypothetical protein [Chitinophagales bacterium]HQD11821.1 hypothetical protein [Chitinophagales bacterium]HQO88536.1 hypothetical protein [Chitinophagales bacterium]
MRIITIAVPEDDVMALDALLQQTDIHVVDDKEEEIEVYIFESEEDEDLATLEEDLRIMQELERELDAEIWNLHHLEHKAV